MVTGTVIRKKRTSNGGGILKKMKRGTRKNIKTEKGLSIGALKYNAIGVIRNQEKSIKKEERLA